MGYKGEQRGEKRHGERNKTGTELSSAGTPGRPVGAARRVERVRCEPCGSCDRLGATSQQQPAAGLLCRRTCGLAAAGWCWATREERPRAATAAGGGEAGGCGHGLGTGGWALAASALARKRRSSDGLTGGSSKAGHTDRCGQERQAGKKQERREKRRAVAGLNELNLQVSPRSLQEGKTEGTRLWRSELLLRETFPRQQEFPRL